MNDQLFLARSSRASRGSEISGAGHNFRTTPSPSKGGVLPPSTDPKPPAEVPQLCAVLRPLAAPRGPDPARRESGAERSPIPCPGSWRGFQQPGALSATSPGSILPLSRERQGGSRRERGEGAPSVRQPFLQRRLALLKRMPGEALTGAGLGRDRFQSRERGSSEHFQPGSGCPLTPRSGLPSSQARCKNPPSPPAAGRRPPRSQASESAPQVDEGAAWFPSGSGTSSSRQSFSHR